MTSPQRFYFEGYTLDLTNCALSRGSEQVRLRPKAFDLLRYLVEHAGRLVSKEELIREVWRGVFVTDDSLVQCVRDIRDALADDAHRIVRTVPRRGYLFAAQVSDGSSAGATRADNHDLAPRAAALLVTARRSSLRVATLLLLLMFAGVGGSILSWRSEHPSMPAAEAANPRGVAAPSAPERRVALVIGNSRYRDATLANPRHDAEAVAQSLRRTGFAQVTVEHDLSREQTMTALRAFATDAAEADWAVVYFAGKGLEAAGRSYLLPVDAAPASERDMVRDAIALDEVLWTTNPARKLRLVILDACRASPLADGSAVSASPPSSLTLLPGAEPGRATLVAYATGSGRVAEDGSGQHSPYAAALVRSLEIPGLEMNLMFRSVRDQVLAATDGRQEPFTYGSLPADALYFRPPRAGGGKS